MVGWGWRKGEHPANSFSKKSLILWFLLPPEELIVNSFIKPESDGGMLATWLQVLTEFLCFRRWAISEVLLPRWSLVGSGGGFCTNSQVVGDNVVNILHCVKAQSFPSRDPVALIQYPALLGPALCWLQEHELSQALSFGGFRAGWNYLPGPFSATVPYK